MCHTKSTTLYQQFLSQIATKLDHATAAMTQLHADPSPLMLTSPYLKFCLNLTTYFSIQGAQNLHKAVQYWTLLINLSIPRCPGLQQASQRHSFTDHPPTWSRFQSPNRLWHLSVKLKSFFHSVCRCTLSASCWIVYLPHVYSVYYRTCL